MYARILKGSIVFDELMNIGKKVRCGNDYPVNRIDVYFNTSKDTFEFETMYADRFEPTFLSLCEIAYSNEDWYKGFLSRLSKEAYSELLKTSLY